MTLTLALMLGVTGSSALSQHRARHRTPKPPPTRKVAATPKVTAAPIANHSTGGISFGSVAPDGEGGVWFGGKVLQSGLLVHSGGGIKAVAVHNLPGLEDLTFTTPETGWFISQGDLYATRDINKVLARVNIDTRQYLKKVYFFNPQFGWVIGESGAIYHTDDGGRTWGRQDSGTDYDLKQIQFVSPLDGWIAAYEHQSPPYSRTFLATNDGGQTWREIRYENSPTPYAFLFLDSFEGWAIDLKDNIIHTSDGGKSWSVVRRPEKNDAWASVHFVNRSEGWVVGDGILHTADGGKTWEYQEPPSNDAGKTLDNVYFTDSENGWAVGFFRALKTNDGGATWSPISEEWKQPILSAALGETSANR